MKKILELNQKIEKEQKLSHWSKEKSLKILNKGGQPKSFSSMSIEQSEVQGFDTLVPKDQQTID